MEKFTRMVQWIETNGGYVDKDLYLHIITENNRTLRTKSKKKLNDILAKIPLKCIINTNNNIRRVVTISINLLKEIALGTESFFHPYIDILPTAEQLNYLSLYTYTREHMEEIKNVSTFFYNEFNTYWNEIDEMYRLIQGSQQLHSCYKTIEWCKYCVAIYHTRSVANTGLIPLADLMQHENINSSVRALVKEKEFFNLCCSNSVREGEDIVVNYGFLNRVQLYVRYGITCDFNINYMRCNINGLSTVTPVQKALLSKYNYTNTPLLFSDQGVFQSTMRYARILNITDTEFKEPDNFSNFGVLSIDNECHTFRFLVKVLSTIRDKDTHNEKYKIISELVQKDNHNIDMCLTSLAKMWLRIINLSSKLIE